MISFLFSAVVQYPVSPPRADMEIIRKLMPTALAVLIPLFATAQASDKLPHSIPVLRGAGAEKLALLGYSVAADGPYIVAGAPRDYNYVSMTSTGMAKVFDSKTGKLLFILPETRLTFNDYFGISVAISGSRVVVGAYFDDTGQRNAGRAYVFDLAGATPTVPIATLNNPSPAEEDNFGNSVAISGTRVVVGAWQDDSEAVNSGSAYVYDLSTGTPTVPVATLTNPSPAHGDRFGVSVAVSGTRVVVGANQDNTGASFAGSAYVYDLICGTPTVPVVTLNNPSPAASESFGISVAISGDQLVVGAHHANNTESSASGSAYVYDLSTGTPTVPVATLNNPITLINAFGGSVAISGPRVIVGAYVGGMGTGSAYVYDLTSATPTVPMVRLNNPDPTAQDNFGRSVAISGNRVVVGTPYDDPDAETEDAGNAYIYDLTSLKPGIPVLTLNNSGPAGK